MFFKIFNYVYIFMYDIYVFIFIFFIFEVKGGEFEVDFGFWGCFYGLFIFGIVGVVLVIVFCMRVDCFLFWCSIKVFFVDYKM